MTPEGRVKRDVKRLLNAIDGAWYYMPVQNGMGVVGIPDFVACVRGRFVGIETKAPGRLKALTPNQKRRLAEIEAAGGLALVIDDVAKLREALEKEGLL